MRGDLGVAGLIRLAMLAALGVVLLGGCTATSASVDSRAQSQTRPMG